MPPFSGSPHCSTITPCPETVASERGETNRVPFGVTMTRTSAPASLSLRTNSGVLYAAIPPVTPKTIFMVARLLGCQVAGNWATGNPATLLRFFQRRRLFYRRRELPLHLVLIDLFHRDARRLGVLASHLRLRALDDLFGALG